MRRDLRVELKTVDLVRATAWLALTEKLGWSGTLLALSRATFWRFEGEAKPGVLVQNVIEAELERSSAYYNPNKERFVFAPGEGHGDGQLLEAGHALPAPSVAAGGEWRAELLLTDEGGQRSDLLARSGPRLTADGFRLQGLVSGCFWSLSLRARSAEEARGFLTGLALSRGRHEGLLFNPHYQEGHLLALAPVPEEATN